MTDPARLSRLLLAIAVSVLRAISEGSQSEDNGDGEPLYNVAKGLRRRSSGTRGRRNCLYNVGRSLIEEIIMTGKRFRPIILRAEPLCGQEVVANTS